MSVQFSDDGLSSVCEWDFLDEEAMFVDGPIKTLIPTVHECQNAPLVMQSALSSLQHSASNSQYGLFGQAISVQ